MRRRSWLPVGACAAAARCSRSAARRPRRPGRRRRCERDAVEAPAPSDDRADRRRSARRRPPPCARSVSIDLRLAGDAVPQPVGDVLAADAQRRAVFHQADVRGCRAPSNSRRPGRSSAPRSRGCPAHCCRAPAAISRRRDAGASQQRDAEDVVQLRASAAGRELLLPREHVDLVIVDRVQRRRGRGGHPGGVGAGLRMRRSSARSMSAIRSGIAHMPLPICALPGRPQARPISTLRSS